MDDRDLEIVAYIMIQKMTKDMLFMLAMHLNMLYIAAKRTELDEDLDSAFAEMTNTFRTYIELSNELTNILIQRLGCDHDASERRRRVNGELMKLPGISVRDRLRAATLMVSNQNKVDLFFSLPDELKAQYVTMLLDRVI